MRRLITVLSLAAVLGVPVVSALATATPGAGHRPVRGRDLVVARVTGVSGRQLFVKRRHKLVRLSRGATVKLGELVVLGPSTKARFHMSLPRSPRITAATYVLYIARYHRLPMPRASRVEKQFGVIAYGVRTHHTIRLQPRYLEFAR